MFILWAILAIAAISFAVETAFVYCAAAKRLLGLGLLPGDMKLVAYFWLIVGYVADALFNLTRGTLEFRELPRELLFSSRVQRHYLGPLGWRLEKARRWAALLNAVAPGHIHEARE